MVRCMQASRKSSKRKSSDGTDSERSSSPSSNDEVQVVAVIKRPRTAKYMTAARRQEIGAFAQMYLGNPSKYGAPGSKKMLQELLAYIQNASRPRGAKSRATIEDLGIEHLVQWFETNEALRKLFSSCIPLGEYGIGAFKNEIGVERRSTRRKTSNSSGSPLSPDISEAVQVQSPPLKRLKKNANLQTTKKSSVQGKETAEGSTAGGAVPATKMMQKISLQPKPSTSAGSGRIIMERTIPPPQPKSQKEVPSKKKFPTKAQLKYDPPTLTEEVDDEDDSDSEDSGHEDELNPNIQIKQEVLTEDEEDGQSTTNEEHEQGDEGSSSASSPRWNNKKFEKQREIFKATYLGEEQQLATDSGNGTIEMEMDTGSSGEIGHRNLIPIYLGPEQLMQEVTLGPSGAFESSRQIAVVSQPQPEKRKDELSPRSELMKLLDTGNKQIEYPLLNPMTGSPLAIKVPDATAATEGLSSGVAEPSYILLQNMPHQHQNNGGGGGSEIFPGNQNFNQAQINAYMNNLIAEMRKFLEMNEGLQTLMPTLELFDFQWRALESFKAFLRGEFPLNSGAIMEN